MRIQLTTVLGDELEVGYAAGKLPISIHIARLVAEVLVKNIKMMVRK
ncbi:hypothetical protein [Roseivirga misakiensis]|nr:hypothetical protein [Roseivirga misakiensis]